MKKVMLSFESIQVFFCALFFLSQAPIHFFARLGYGSIGSIIFSVIMYTSVLISVYIIIHEKQDLSQYAVLLLFGVLIIIQQTIIVDYSFISEYYYQLFIISAAAYTVGKAILNNELFIKYVGGISIFLALFLIQEPFTFYFLNIKDSMMLGYICLPVDIFLFAYWYCQKRSKSLLFLAVAFAAVIVLFSSRGCGISIISFLLVLWIDYSRNKGVRKRLQYIFVLIAVAFICVLFLTGIESNSYTQEAGLVGSAVQKISAGKLFDSNGRFEIWATSLKLLKDNLLFGVGIGSDRVMNAYVKGYAYTHNIVLEVLLDFGVLLGGVIIICYIRRIVKALKIAKGTNEFVLIMALVCIILIRLLVSDSYLNNTYRLFFLLGMSDSVINTYRVRIKKQSN